MTRYYIRAEKSCTGESYLWYRAFLKNLKYSEWIYVWTEEIVFFKTYIEAFHAVQSISSSADSTRIRNVEIRDTKFV